MNSPDQRQLRDLLASAVPDLPEPPDRIGAVARRVAQARTRRCASIAAVVLVVAGSAFAVGDLRTEDTLSPAAVASLPATAPACPPTFDADHEPEGHGARGVLAPAGAIRATLCVYLPGAGPVEHWTVLSVEVRDLVSVLNDLPDYAAMKREYSDEPVDGCYSADRTQYRIILEYPDRSPATIDVNLSCGNASRGDVIRYRNVTRPLKKFAEVYDGHGTGPDFPDDGW